MNGRNPRLLLDKVNPICRTTLESAISLCVARTHYAVDVEHWLYRLIEQPQSDVARILAHQQVDGSQLRRDLERSMGLFQSGNTRAPSLHRNILTLAKEAWLTASLEFGATQIRSGHLLLAYLKSEELQSMAGESAAAWKRISSDAVSQKFREITAGDAEDTGAISPVNQGAVGAPAEGGPLARFTIDLTERARQGLLDPVLGRDSEIRQMIDILTRRRQNNPILVGEAGVGKTAVVEGLALRIAVGDIPGPLRDCELRSLDLGLLQAGAGVRGEFEQRLKGVIEDVKASPRPIILFIDEAHSLIGAGGSEGMGDAANLLKPALARGELRTVAATTWAEYKQYFEQDAALTRRFQAVKIAEPDEATAVRMLRGLVGMFERHHGLRVLDEALEAAVRLSHRYIADRQLPDKAASVLSTACARVALSQSTTPEAVERSQRQVEAIDSELQRLDLEVAAGADWTERIARLQVDRQNEQLLLTTLQQRWQQESAQVKELLDISARLMHPQQGDPSAGSEDLDQLRRELAEARARLAKSQGDEPLVHPCVDAQSIAEVVASWTGIPVGKVVKDEIETILTLPESLSCRVIGQAHALETIAQRMRAARAGLEDNRRPRGVFLLVGPSGVGKTETALALAEALYGGERNLITINMSEYKEVHRISSLTGAPAGYVGYGKGGVLTEAVRRRPHSAILLDEIEKAHPDVTELFYQVFDRGILADAAGREVDFRNTVILMTSNLGTDTIMRCCDGSTAQPEPRELAEAIRGDLLRHFKPAFLGRLIVVPYYPVRDDALKAIIRMQLDRIGSRLQSNHGATLECAEDVVQAIARRCTEVDSGARNIDAILTRTLLPDLARELLTGMASGQHFKRATVSVAADGAFHYQVA